MIEFSIYMRNNKDVIVRYVGKRIKPTLYEMNIILQEFLLNLKEQQDELK